jgi:hypothetical protein
MLLTLKPRRNFERYTINESLISADKRITNPQALETLCQSG